VKNGHVKKNAVKKSRMKKSHIKKARDDETPAKTRIGSSSFRILSAGSAEVKALAG
jgi:hypothetical protein